MSKLTKLINNPQQFLFDARPVRELRASVDALRQGRYRARFGVNLGGGVTQEAVQEALLSSTPMFTVDAPSSEQVACGCWIEHIGQVVQAAAVLASTLYCELVVVTKKRRDTVDRQGVGALINSLSTQPSFELQFLLGKRLVASFEVVVWERLTHENTAQCKGTNPYARRVRMDDFQRFYDSERKHLHLSRYYAQPVDAECTFDVDFVYTWVNHDDPQWRALISRFKNVSEIEWDRYLNVDELRYSLRSVAKYAPWVRKIYVVTNCNPPKWLAEDPRVEFVPHEDVFQTASDCLPTFSSHSIEACLANIPGLAEHFVYFNDDFFLSAPASKSTFFTSNGCSISYLESYGTVAGEVSPTNPDYLNAAINGRGVIERLFQRSPTQLHLHVPYALRVSVLKELEERLPQDFARVRAARFRTPQDLSTVSFLYHHYAYQKAAAVRRECRALLVKGNRYKKEFAQLLAAHDYMFFCINDGEESASDKNYLARKSRFLSAMYPDPAPWEVT